MSQSGVFACGTTVAGGVVAGGVAAGGVIDASGLRTPMWRCTPLLLVAFAASFTPDQPEHGAK